MEQLLEFITDNWMLVLAFMLILGYWVGAEIYHFSSGVKTITPETATQLYNRDNALFVDIRNNAEYRKSHLPGAFHMPSTEVDQLLDKLRRHQSQPLIVYDANGLQANKTARRLRKAGFETVYQLKTGLTGWESAGYPMERGKTKPKSKSKG